MSNPIPPAVIREVMARDGGVCQKCGGRGSDLHHCVYGGTGRRRIHKVENIVTLCLYCHSEAHSTKVAREWTYEWSRGIYGGVIDELLREKWEG